MTVYRRPDPIPLPHARPVHGAGRAAIAAPSVSSGQVRPPASNLSEKFARDLALGLMEGRFLRDGVLWTEPQLCDAFGISRTALREAIKILSAKGIVETRRKRGTILRNRSDWNLLDPDVIRWLLIADPERTASALAEALTVLARAADATARSGPLERAVRNLTADIEKVRRIGNPFLSAFAETTRGALGHDPAGAEAKQPAEHKVED